MYCIVNIAASTVAHSTVCAISSISMVIKNILSTHNNCYIFLNYLNEKKTV